MIWTAIPALAAAAYYALALVACARWKRPRAAGKGSPPPGISILKPVHGRDPRFWEAICAHASQDYPEFEILFGTGLPADPALEDVERLRRAYPHLRIESYVTSSSAPNAKVGVLAELARQARYPVLLVNDSDILVERDYLRTVVAPLADPNIGMVTCLYRAAASSTAAAMEALGIATEFAPSVLVARLLGVAEFALGSTMVFRASDLARIGGFESIAAFIADDYQLGLRITQLGLHVEFATQVVETDLGGGDWASVWRHQLRWLRTIRVSRPGGYYGYVVTNATIWSAVALAGGHWLVALIAMSLRMGAGIWTGAAILRDRNVLRRALWIPLRDVFGFAVWTAGLAGKRVQWRDRVLQLRPDGRIE